MRNKVARKRSRKSSSNNRIYSNRHKRSRRKNRSIYIKRRIGLIIILLIILGLIYFFFFKNKNEYQTKGYPQFKDEVLKDLEDEVFVSNSKGRSLTVAEKSDDLRILKDTFMKNYAFSNTNKDIFISFIKNFDSFNTKVKNSKTDQEFYDVIDEYLASLEDPSIKLIDKKTYDNYFDYYKNNKTSYLGKVLGEASTVDRYERLINKKEIDNHINITSPKQGVILIRLNDFNISSLKDDIDIIIEAFENNNQIDNIVFDLSGNSSMDYLYAKEFSSYFIDKDLTIDSTVYFRGHIFEKSVENIKDSKELATTVDDIKSISNTPINDDNSNIDFEYYKNSARVRSVIDKKDTFRKRSLYVLTDENTANEATRMAYIFKNSNAYLIKNSFESTDTANDIINPFRVNFISLPHSGLVISLKDTISDKDKLYLEYDLRINSNDPIDSILNQIK